MLSGWTRTYAEIIVCRLAMGFWEAGTGPGTMYLLSSWYRRNERCVPPVSWLIQ